MRAFLPVVLSLAACAPPERAPARHDPVLGGTAAPEATHTFLLDIRFTGGASVCSAVLVSPRVLLTAAHCVDPALRGVPSLLVRATNEPDDSMLTLADFIEVRTTALLPGWNPADDMSDFDLAALHLARAPLGVSPVPLARWLEGTEGRALEVVGYGRFADTPDASTSSGTRRAVSTPVTRVTAANLEFGAATEGLCLGDSGGPSLLDGALAGIHSRNDATVCGNGIDIRVDRHQPFIDGFVAANDPQPCVADGRCALGCTTTDVDCRCQHDGRCDAACGAADLDCLPDGTACAADAQCQGGVCLPDAGRCSRACSVDTACTGGWKCLQALCREPPPFDAGTPQPDAGAPDAGKLELETDAGQTPSPAPLGCAVGEGHWVVVALVLLRHRSLPRRSRIGPAGS